MTSENPSFGGIPTSNGFPINMPYGMNFFDIFLQNIMKNGFDGITFATFMSLWMYMANDKIKLMLQYLTQKVEDKIRLYGIMGYEKAEKYFWIILDVFQIYLITMSYDLFEQFKEWFYEKFKELEFEKFKEWVFEKCKKWSFKKSKSHECEDKSKKDCATEVAESNTDSVCKKYQIWINISIDNMIDLLALSYYLMSKRNELEFIDFYDRPNTSLYLAQEVYILPKYIEWKDSSYSEIDFSFATNVDFNVTYEIHKKNEILKSIRCDCDGEKTVTFVTDNSLSNLLLSKKFFHNHEMIAIIDNIRLQRVSYHGNDNKYWEWKRSFFVGEFIILNFLIFYNFEKDIFLKFIEFLAGGNKMMLSQSFYEMTNISSFFPSFLKGSGETINTEEFETFCESAKLKKYIVDLKENVEKYPKLSEYLKNTYTKIFNTINKTFIQISLSSKSISTNELMTKSRNFTQEILEKYYKENMVRIGNKINIYKLDIKYRVEKDQMENPLYAEWMEKYGNFENATRKQQDSTDDDKEEKEDKEEKKDKHEDKIDNQSKGTKANRHGNFVNENNSDMMYGKYIPQKPVEFKQYDKYIPYAEQTFIKTDRKPLEYLYLQEKKKKTLVNYLNNFKEGRENYEKYGMPYKGGIILSGSPGCGKSSTIIAIGTFLDKDIFYIDLGKITTNTELQLLLDHIKMNHQNGGIVIFEDIDCMTDIVFKRSATIEPHSKKTKNEKNDKDDKLNLSFLLNVLDGTLAPENFIFIITTNHLDKLDPALIRSGRMDINIVLDKCDRYQLKTIYSDLYSKHLQPELLNKFPENTYIVADVILHLFHSMYNKEIEQEELLSKFIDQVGETNQIDKMGEHKQIDQMGEHKNTII